MAISRHVVVARPPLHQPRGDRERDPATTKTWLSVHAELDQNEYPLKAKIPDKQMKTRETDGVLTRHDWHPEWN